MATTEVKRVRYHYGNMTVIIYGDEFWRRQAEDHPTIKAIKELIGQAYDQEALPRWEDDGGPVRTEAF